MYNNADMYPSPARGSPRGYRGTPNSQPYNQRRGGFQQSFSSPFAPQNAYGGGGPMRYPGSGDGRWRGSGGKPQTSYNRGGGFTPNSSPYCNTGQSPYNRFSNNNSPSPSGRSPAWQQRETAFNVADYVIPEMTQNPWHHLETKSSSNDGREQQSS